MDDFQLYNAQVDFRMKSNQFNRNSEIEIIFRRPFLIASRINPELIHFWDHVFSITNK